MKELKNGNIEPYEIDEIVDRFEYGQTACGLNLIYTKEFCDCQKDWRLLVSEYLKFGKSIFMEMHPRIPFKNIKETEFLNYIERTYLLKNYGINIFM